MKKYISKLTGILVCWSVIANPLNAAAFDPATYQEYREQLAVDEANTFPNPELQYTIATEGDYVFHVYADFAVLSECKNTEITEAIIPETVNNIPVVGMVDSPFSYCHKLTSITLPDRFEHFFWYDLVENITTTVGSDEECLPSVSEVIVSDTNPYYTVADGLLYTKDMKTLVGCSPTFDMVELTISEQADTIGEYAFSECLNLEKAELPENITYIPGDMFFFCQSLSEVSFKGELQRIGYGAFNECAALTDFTIPDSVTKIGWHAFKNTGCAENVDGLWYVQDWFVDSDPDIDTAVIREGTAGIAEMALFAKTNTTVVDIPSSVVNVGDAIYSGFPSGVLSVLHYRAGHIPENSIATTRSSTDIYIHDPFCEIFDSEKTISPVYRYYTQDDSQSSFITNEKLVEGDIVIHGYTGSTAQEYAEKYNRKFEEIRPSGDVNADGTFNISDVVLLQKWLLMVPDTHMKNWKEADLCEDNQLDVFDLCLMKRALITQIDNKDI